MKKLKKFQLVMACSIIFALVSPLVLPINNQVVATAATTVKLNKKTLTLTEGKTATLKISGTKEIAKWTTSKKSVATVTQKGKVTAKKAGTTKITAIIGSKSYTCTVTVTAKNDENTFVTDAPFSAQETIIGQFKTVIPKDWNNTIYETPYGVVYLVYPSTGDINIGTSNVTFLITETGSEAISYDVFKELLTEQITENYMSTVLSEQLGLTDLEILDFKTSDTETKLGTAFTTEYSYVSNGVTVKQRMYNVSIDKYIIKIASTDIGDSISPDVVTVAEYILNSLQALK